MTAAIRPAYIRNRFAKAHQESGGQMKKVSSQIERVREHSRSLVLDSLLERSDDRLSRSDISWATGLSNPTVSTVLQEFLQLELIEEVGQSSTTGGRPAQLVRLKPQASCVLSVDLAVDATRALLLDLTGTVLEREAGPAFGEGESEQLFLWLGGIHERWTRSYRLGRLAVALPGVIDHGRGTVHLAPALGWHNYPLAARLTELLSLPVTLENDVNALALGEIRFGASPPKGNALFLSITSGVGMGLVLNGELYRGSNFAAGEVGYSLLPGRTPAQKSVLGESGPLEDHLLMLSRDFLVAGRIELSSDTARSAFGSFAADLGMVVQNAACLLNPDRLTISWPADPDGLLLQVLRDGLSTPMPLELTVTSLGQDATAIGVAALALDELVLAFCSLSGG